MSPSEEVGMSLKEWLKRNNLTHADFAAMCGCTRAAVTRWASGSRAPSPKWLKVIERKTKNQVTAYGAVSSEREMAFLEIYRKGYTVSAAAKKLRIHRNTLSRYFSGQSYTPSDIVSKIYKLAGLE